MQTETSLVELRRITREHPDDVEFIRVVRNSFLNQHVYLDNHFIERHEHEAWFAGLDDARDFFFVIVEKSSHLAVGITGCYQKRAPAGSGEISIYITKENKSLLAPFHAMTLLLQFIFEALTLERAFGAFYRQNSQAIRFNAAFGFQKYFEDESWLKTELTAMAFQERRESLKRFLD